MARRANKVIRYIVWCTADREYRNDLIAAFEERFEEVYNEFGAGYAHWWSVSQAIRSMPYGLIAKAVRWALFIWSLAA